MPRRSLALLPVATLLACSAPPPAAAPLPSATASSPAPSASVAAPVPRKTNGTPVVLALRTPTVEPGAEWAWIMPEGRLVTLAPPDKEGRRGLLGPNFFTGPDGAFVGLEKDGGLAIAADGEIHRLGIFEHAAFDAKGQRVLAWNGAEWALFSRKGDRLHASSLAVARPLLMPSGGLVMHLGSAHTTIFPPGAERPEQVGMRCDESYATASRIVCFDDTDPTKHDIGPRKRNIVVVSLDTGKELGRFPLESLKSARPAVAFRADGQALALAGETIAIIDLAHDGQKASSRTIFRRTSASWWRTPRMGFTADGKRLCVEEAEGTLVLDTAASEFKNAAAKGRKSKDARSVCLFVPRGDEASGPYAPNSPNEWDAVPLTVPVRDGWEPPARIFSARNRLESEALSFDRKTGALVELHTEDSGQKRRLEGRVVVIDGATGAVKHLIPFGTAETTTWNIPSVPEVVLSDDGALLHVCAARLIGEGCRDYDPATGKSTDPVVWPRPRSSHTQFALWDGKWPDAFAVPVLSALGIPEDQGVRVTQWKDEGRYVSIEMDVGGGATERLNMPDAPERVVRDVAAVAGGAMLGIVVQGAVELWNMQPLEIQAVLVATGTGGAALFADGSVETFGDGENALGCQQGEAIVPIDRCGDVRATKGTLLALVTRAAKKAPKY